MVNARPRVRTLNETQMARKSKSHLILRSLNMLPVVRIEAFIGRNGAHQCGPDAQPQEH